MWINWFFFFPFLSLLLCIFIHLEKVDKKAFLTRQLIFSECNFNLVSPSPPWSPTCAGTVSICIAVPLSPPSRGAQEGPPGAGGTPQAHGLPWGQVLPAAPLPFPSLCSEPREGTTRWWPSWVGSHQWTGTNQFCLDQSPQVAWF